MNSSLKKLHAALALAVVLALPLVQVPNAYSAEWTASDETLFFLTDVVKLDMAKYNVTLVSDIVAYPSDLGGLAKEHLYYTLESDESKLTVMCDFKNNTLDYCNLRVLEGSPLYAQPSANVLDEAKGLLDRYRTCAATSHLQDLQVMRNMLDMVTEIKPMNITSGNVKLVISTGDYASFEWIYTSNGIDAPRKRIGFYFEHGYLRSFKGSWNLYSIGSTDINVSKEEAIRIAREHAENYTLKIWTGNWTVMNFTIVDEPLKAEFSMERREPLTLYPFWRIQLYFDKAYGTANGIEVGIWADTGEVIFCQATGIAGGVPVEENPPTQPSPEPNLPLTEPSPEPTAQPSPTPEPAESPLPQTQQAPPTSTYVAAAAAAVLIPIAIAAIALKKRRK